MTKLPKPTNIDCLKRFLIEQPHKHRIMLMDKEADKLDKVRKANDAIRSRRNIKGNENA